MVFIILIGRYVMNKMITKGVAASEDDRIDRYRFVFLMDPYSTLNLGTDTSLLLMEELIARGHQVFWLEVDDLYLSHQQARGRLQRVESVSPFLRSLPEDCELDEYDALLVRIDPPVDSQYMHVTQILDQLDDSVMQFNDVAALRNFNEKLLPLRWPELTPPSVVTKNESVLASFLAKHGDIVIKPLGDCSGRGIHRLRLSSIDGQTEGSASTTTSSVVNINLKSQYIMAQKFLHNVSEGDKRVYLVDGEVVGYVNRIPRKGSFLANIHQGAQCKATMLTKKEKDAIELIAPFIKDNGLFFVGVDFIDGYVTEINFTSPSAIRQINEVMGEAVHRVLVDKMLDKVSNKILNTMPDTLLNSSTPAMRCCGC